MDPSSAAHSDSEGRPELCLTFRSAQLTYGLDVLAKLCPYSPGFRAWLYNELPREFVALPALCLTPVRRTAASLATSSDLCAETGPGELK